MFVNENPDRKKCPEENKNHKTNNNRHDQANKQAEKHENKIKKHNNNDNKYTNLHKITSKLLSQAYFAAQDYSLNSHAKTVSVYESKMKVMMAIMIKIRMIKK